MINPKQYSYAFIRYEKRQDAILAKKHLNYTNLLGANGKLKARIEFSYKSKIGDRLEPNMNTPKMLEGDSNQNLNLITDSFRNEGSQLNSSSVIETKFEEKAAVISDTKETKNEAQINDKFEFTISKSSEKMLIDEENIGNNESKTSKAEENKNNNDNKVHECFKENKHYDSYSNRERKYDKDFERSGILIKFFITDVFKYKNNFILIINIKHQR